MRDAHSRHGHPGARVGYDARQTVQFLVDMGFQRYDVIEALRVTQNDRNAACAWLLGVCDGRTSARSGRRCVSPGRASSWEGAGSGVRKAMARGGPHPVSGSRNGDAAGGARRRRRGAAGHHASNSAGDSRSAAFAGGDDEPSREPRYVNAWVASRSVLCLAGVDLTGPTPLPRRVRASLQRSPRLSKTERR